MSDVFDAPAAADRAHDPYTSLPNDVQLTVAGILLLVPAVFTGGFTLILVVMTFVSLFVDIPTEPGTPPMYVIAPIEGLFCLMPTMLYGVAAIGVFRRHKVGWFLGMLGFALWMGGCLMPLGLFGVYALLCAGGRKAFGI